MKQYIVKVTVGGKRYQFAAIARSWLECWTTAVDEFGIRARVLVRPA